VKYREIETEREGGEWGSQLKQRGGGGEREVRRE
jgi:hypothetical protein